MLQLCKIILYIMKNSTSQHTNFVPLLQSLGLSHSEAKVYLAAIRLGPASAIQLARHSGLTRQMIYTLLPQLIEKSLIKEITFGSRRLFQALNVTALRDRAEMIVKEVKNALPLLKLEQATNRTLPTIQVYENPLSMREWYRRFMKEATPDDELLLWVTNKVWMSMDPDFLKRFITFKNSLQIHDKIIAPDTHESCAYAAQMNQPYAEYRFMRQPWKSGAEKWIWRNTISYLTISENATNLITVESAALAELERAAFFAVWKTLL